MPTKDKTRRREAQRRYRAKHPERVNQFTSRQKAYRSLQARAKRYGLPVQQIQAILDKAVCGICGEPGKHIDHCHVTGKVRDLLCANCNTFLGKLEKRLGTLDTYLGYLKKHRGY